MENIKLTSEKASKPTLQPTKNQWNRDLATRE